MNKYDNRNNTTNNNRKKEVVTYTDYNIFNGKVKVVGEGPEPRIMFRDEAIELAKSRGMNLVQVAYNKSDFPHSICKILDYSKFKYEQKKREKEAKKRQKANIAEVKEIKFSIRIDDGDKHTKVNKVKELLAEGDKVKLSIKLLRREMDRMDFARDTMRSILVELEGSAEMDTPPELVGNVMSCIVRGKK
jgi:translation initiation factor IF-3